MLSFLECDFSPGFVVEFPLSFCIFYAYLSVLLFMLVMKSFRYSSGSEWFVEEVRSLGCRSDPNIRMAGVRSLEEVSILLFRERVIFSSIV